MFLVKTMVLMIAYMLFFFLSGYVFLLGKNGSGIKQDYFLTCFILVILIGVYSG